MDPQSRHRICDFLERRLRRRSRSPPSWCTADIGKTSQSLAIPRRGLSHCGRDQRHRRAHPDCSDITPPRCLQPTPILSSAALIPSVFHRIARVLPVAHRDPGSPNKEGHWCTLATRTDAADNCQPPFEAITFPLAELWSWAQPHRGDLQSEAIALIIAEFTHSCSLPGGWRSRFADGLIRPGDPFRPDCAR